MNAIALHMLKCNMCKGGDPFRCPNDHVGVALMTEHLRDEHDVGPLAEDRRQWVKPLPEVKSWEDLPQ